MREIEITLLVELTREQNVFLVCDYANRHFVAAKIYADMKRLTGEHIFLKNDTVEVEKIRRNAYDIMHEETRREQSKRPHDMEL